MGVFDDWWNSLGPRRQSIAIGLTKVAIKDLPETEPAHLEEIAATILGSDHQIMDCGERFRFMTDFIQRCEGTYDLFDAEMEERGIASHPEVVKFVENEVQNNIEIKADILGLLLKESTELSYLTALALKIIDNTIVDHEGDMAGLEEEGKQLERELFAAHGTEPGVDLELGELVEWEIDLSGCPNLQCQYNNPPGEEYCKKCHVCLLRECPECYNEIPINSIYCRVCGKTDLEEWGMLQRFSLSIETAIEQGNYAQAATLVTHIPEELAGHPDLVSLKQKLLEHMPPRKEERMARLTQKIEDLCSRWLGKIKEILAEKRPNFVLASQSLDLMPAFLRNDEVAELRKQMEIRRRQMVEDGRARKRNLLLQQIDLFQEKGKYKEALAEIDKLLPALQDEAIVKKKAELEETIAEVEKLRARLQGPSWAYPGELQKKVALQQKLPVAREFELSTGVSLRFILIPPGSFDMGSDAGYENECPVHRVEFAVPFYLAITPVTQAQWLSLSSGNPSCFKGDQLPVEHVSWDECSNFVIALAKKFGETFRLPTEAEWEYACRAETTTPYFFGKDASSLPEYAWFNKNSEKTTHAVAAKKSNNWGLFDMHGNVWQWCQDCYDEKYYEKSPRQNPMGPLGDRGAIRVCRGGSWSNIPSDLRSSTRQGYPPNFRSPTIGFRPLLVIKR